MEPTEEEIGLVIDFASLDPIQDRTLVIQALKSNGRDTQRVLQEYFEDATSFKTKYLNASQWDDGMFSGDRNGGDNNGGFSYHVEAPPEHDVIQGIDPMDGNAPGAPSRPPSRTNSKSPLGKMVDWAASDTHGVPSSQAQEDEDMERALRVSRQEAGIPAQENGVVDNSTAISNFGPANRDHYEQNNWAMVPTGPQKTLTSHAPPASARKRATGAPAFMVQGFSNSGLNHLGGLLTILHEVPLARNILLSLGEPAATYGHNSEWWNGQEILPDHVLAKMASGELQWGEQDESLPNLESEIHRIMSFLDSTERAYGTVSVLSGMIGADRGAEKQFYETIAFRNAEKITQLTQVAALCEVHGESSTEEEVANFGMLDMEHPRSEYGTIKTLYESLDHVMWNDALTWNEIHEGTKMATFKQIGETLVLKVGGDGPEDSIEIPLELYPEKYLSNRRAESGRIQAAWVETKVQAEQLQQAEQTLTIWRDEWDSKKYDKKHLVQKAMGQWKSYHAYLESLGRYRSMENSGFDTHKYPSHHAAPVDATEKEGMLKGQVDEAIRTAEKLVEDIDSRLQWLQSESKRVFEKQRYIGRLLTDPSKARPRPMSCSKYLLRGVATTIDVIYVCRRSEPDLIELEETPKPRDQWWRLSRSPDQEQIVEKVEVERVLRDMWQETKTPLLVYATEDALNTTPEPLSGPLERFVKADNKSFRQELNQEQSQANGQPPPSTEVVSPSKRKHRADSLDSMNSNRASLGSIDMEDREDPFADNGGTAPDLLGQEMEERQSSGLADPTGKQDQPFAAIELEQQQPGQSVFAEPETSTAAETGETVTSTPGRSRNPTPSTTTQGEFSRTLSPDAEAVRSPEMQEKSRPPTFMTSPSRGGEKAQTADAMDMELPHSQE